jgi:hypothetical protein
VRRFWRELSSDPALITTEIIRKNPRDFGGIGVVRL